MALMVFSQIMGVIMFFVLRPFYAKENSNERNEEKDTEMQEIISNSRRISVKPGLEDF